MTPPHTDSLITDHKSSHLIRYEILDIIVARVGRYGRKGQQFFHCDFMPLKSSKVSCATLAKAGLSVDAAEWLTAILSSNTDVLIVDSMDYFPETNVSENIVG